MVCLQGKLEMVELENGNGNGHGKWKGSFVVFAVLITEHFYATGIVVGMRMCITIMLAYGLPHVEVYV